jgi:hypothetical protein
VAQVNQSVWVVGYGKDQLPVIRGIDPQTGKVTTERKLKRPNTQISFQASGNFALSFHSQSGALSVFHLPDIQNVKFALQGYALTAPYWSPTAEQFAIGAARVDKPNDLGVFLVDVNSLKVTWIDGPDYPEWAALSIAWSKGGDHITYTASGTGPDKKALVAPLTIMDVATQQATTLELSGYEAVDWAAGDTQALLRKKSDADSVPLFAIYDTASHKANPLSEADGIEVALQSYSPASPRLGLIGQTLLSGEYGLYVFQPGQSSELKPLISSPDAGLIAGKSLYWSTDGTAVMYVAPSLDPVVTSLGTPQGIFALDVASSTSIRLSQDGLLIDPNSIQVSD